VGPVLGVVPFNFPCNLLAHKLAPALASGCSIVIKPSPKAPLTTLLMAAACEDAGIPPGLVSVMPCADDVAGRLVADERFKLLSFTGSPKVGWHLKSMAGKKRVHLELGNNSGVIIHDDCPDLEWAARRCAMGAFAYGGQSCISVQRIYVHRSVCEEVTGLLAAAAADLVVGDPLQDATDIGPLVDAQSAERVIMWIEEAVDDGARVVCGASDFQVPDLSACYLAPHVLVGVDHSMHVMNEETFGPVVGIMMVADADEGVRLANDSCYGLTASVWTQDAERGLALMQQLEAGTVYLNRCDYLDPGLAWTGVKDSGHGASLSHLGFGSVTRPKSYHLRTAT
jgi:acyl-CoA reductase-like NAD-dependent aldehyde dehydrogenase